QQRQGDAIKKLNTDLAKVTGLKTLRETGNSVLGDGKQIYAARLDDLENKKGFHDRILLNNSIVVVDTEIEQLRQASLAAQEQKADADVTQKKCKLDEDRTSAKLDAAKAKLLGLAQAMQDRIGAIGTQQKAISDDLQNNNLVQASIDLTGLIEALDGGATQGT